MGCCGPLMRQYAVVIAVNLSSLCLGLGLGWASPVLVKLRSTTDTVLSRAVTEDEGSWIVSIACLTSFFFNLLTPYLVDNCGRKLCVIFCSVVRIIICLSLLFSTELWMILLARGACGLIDPMILCVVPSYASEVANTKIRGALGTIIHIFISLGILIIFSMGPFVSYFTLHIIYTCISVVCAVPVLFISDSPYFLYSKGREEESLKVLTFLRGSEDLARDEIELYSLNNKEAKIRKIELFRNRLFLKSLSFALIFCVGVQFSGHSVVLIYLQTIMEVTGTNIKPELGSVIIGLIPVISGFGTLLVTDRFGRKPVLAISFFTAAVGLFGLGMFFLLKEHNYQISGFLNFVPILSLILFLFSHGSGFGALFLTITSELFDGPARGVGMSIVVSLSILILFLMMKYFADVLFAIGAVGTYWTFSLFCIMNCLFVLFFIPETKGRTFAEIQYMMAGYKGNEDSRL